MSTSEAQKRANIAWKQKNKAKQREYQYRSTARKYVREIANAGDLEDLKAMIDERLKEL